MNSDGQLIDDLQLAEPPEPLRINWLYAIGAIATAWLLWRFIRWRRRTAAVRRHNKDMEKAWMDALAELQRLFALVERGESRPYGTESSSVIRRYIEFRFDLSASRRSTEEFLEEASHSSKLERKHQALLAEFLKICDLLKFARTLADRSELENLHTAAVGFVKETRHQPEPVQ
ncbi:MAG: hypothetical protein JWM59_4877 [Verrucomicrobiales bacterium]|nr:hypothetical protein [Verrucomicrobiales bacterium]